ncbi:MAG TPA: hypothetical protein VNU26_06295, partial [Mycobacteriales bacterium]|nr:hypothetical protein [Mycobacteriales bacterium]
METTARRALSELIDQLLVPGASEPVAVVVPAQAPPASPFVEPVAVQSSGTRPDAEQPAAAQQPAQPPAADEPASWSPQ